MGLYTNFMLYLIKKWTGIVKDDDKDNKVYFFVGISYHPNFLFIFESSRRVFLDVR